MRLKRNEMPNFCAMILTVILIAGATSTCYSGPAMQHIAKAQKSQIEGNYANAISEFYAAIIKEPSYPFTYNYMAVISDVVLNDYDLAATFKEKALSLLKFRKSFMSNEIITNMPADKNTVNSLDEFSIDELDKAIKKLEEEKANLIKKIFDTIESPTYHTYIVLKPKKKLYTQSGTSSKALPPTAYAGQNEFKFLGFHNNWYKVGLTDLSVGWIKWKDINLIYRNKTKPIIKSKVEKFEIYKKFYANYKNSSFADKAKDKLDKLRDGVADEIENANNTIMLSDKSATISDDNTTSNKEQQITEKLKQLDDFYKKGLIDKEEYEKERKEALKEL